MGFVARTSSVAGAAPQQVESLLYSGKEGQGVFCVSLPEWAGVYCTLKRNLYGPDTQFRMFHAERPEGGADRRYRATILSYRSAGIVRARTAPFQNLSVSQTSPPEVMRIDGISKAFGGPPVLHNISLSVPKGSIHGIIGKSGAGKTTLIRIAGLLEKPDAGSVWYEGIAAPVHLLRGRELLEARRKAGFVFQSFNLVASRSAAENVAFPLEAAGWPRAKIRGRVAELLELVGLSDKRTDCDAPLRRREAARVAIARALANHPAILFSDEATSRTGIPDHKVRARPHSAPCARCSA